MRRNSLQVMVGHVPVGGGLAGTNVASVVVQSMTNTDTADAKATIKQVYELWQAGSEALRSARLAPAGVPPQQVQAPRQRPCRTRRPRSAGRGREHGPAPPRQRQ